MDEDERMKVILTARTSDELKIKIKRYYYSYHEEFYETITEKIYDEDNIYKALISRIK
jgi:hypothetical protein